MSVCLFICLLVYLKNRTSKFQGIFCTRYLPVAVARSFADDSAILIALRFCE